MVSLLMIAYALQQLHQLNTAISIERASINDTPVTIYKPEPYSRGSTPIVVISHGFAGSQQLMQPLAVTLARNNYVAITFDYLGHGRHPRPLGGDVTDVAGATQHLIKQTDDIIDYAESLSDSENRLALIGHSMASDIVVRYAIQDERIEATIAISLFSPAVTADKPENFLIVVGELENMLKKEALRVLSMTTASPAIAVTYGKFADGTARRVAFSSNVEHIGVLYSPQTMDEIVNWLNNTFQVKTEVGYIDDRAFTLIILFLGIITLAWPLSRLLPKVTSAPMGAGLGWRQLVPVALFPALLTPILLVAFPADFLSLLVGGYLAVHFLVYGVLTAVGLYFVRFQEKTSREKPRLDLKRALIASGLAILYTTGVIGLAIDYSFTSFAITPLRLPLVFAMLLGTLAYFIADEWLTRGEQSPTFASVFTRGCFLLSLGIAVALSLHELFFLLIIAIVILLYFIIYGLFNSWIYRATGHPVIGATASAVAFAWALAAVFPLISG